MQPAKEQNEINRLAKACIARHFDFLRKTNSTVPLYANEFVLLVLTPFLHSASVSKNKFLTREPPAVGQGVLFRK